MIKYFSKNASNGNWLENAEFTSDKKKADLIIIPGGADWSPDWYGNQNKGLSYVDHRADHEEMTLILSAIKNKQALFGICKGSQGVTIAAKGKLIQHISHPSYHEIITNTGKKYLTNSSHHQMMYPYLLDKDNYELIAWTEGLSNEYLYENRHTPFNPPSCSLTEDGKFKEPEIVYYPKINALGCQWHPEWMFEKNKQNDALDYLNTLVRDKLF